MQLINTSVRTENPNDISYTYFGYAPISCKMVEIFLSLGFEGMMDKLRLLPGRQAFPDNESQFIKQQKSLNSKGKKKIVIIFFIGGVTFAEISAIRFLNQIYQDKKLVVATT